MHAAVPVADMPDALHPGATGYAKMATNWFTALTNYFTPNGSTNAPAISHVYASANLSNVLVTFSKPVADDASTLTNFSLNVGATVLGASLDAVTKRDVTLTTSPLLTNTLYTVNVNGVRDRTTAQTAIAPNSAATFYTYGTAGRGAYNNVIEATNYTLVYSLNIPNTPNFTSGVTYDINLKNSVPTNFTRIAYYLELQASNSPVNYIWVSVDAFTTNLNLIGVPTFPSGAIWQQPLTNMNVLSSMTNIVVGTGLAGGNIEFWPSNYDAVNASNVLNASTTVYDFGDRCTAGNHGSMQIHNHDASQTLFAFNNWNASAAAGLGIGNSALRADSTDWTFADNAASYVVKTLQVYILPAADTNPPVLLSAAGQPVNNIVLNFSKAIAEDATNVTWYSVSGGLTVLSAVVEPLNKLSVTLVTTPQAPATFYTVTVTNVHDRTTNQTPVAPGSMATFMSAAVSGVFANVPEAANYSLVYSLNIPNAAYFNNTNPVYSVDVHAAVSNFTRVAYYLELQAPNGPVNFIWTSMDPFTQDASKIGVPNQSSGALFQQPITNLTVLSSVSGIVLGTNMSGGNMEFWYWNYQEPNDAGVTNASGTVFDWGDRVVVGTLGYGSMQIHNAGASQVLWAFNNWGGTGGGDNCLGIGNNPSGAPDWTHVKNAATYTVKTLQVFVLPANNTNAPMLLGAAGQPGWSNVVLTFSEPLDDSATYATNYALSGGVSVQAAALDPATKMIVTLTTSPQASNTWYTVTANNLTDRTTSHLPIAPNSTARFLSPALSGVFNNISEAANYSLVYSLEVPTIAMFNTSNAPYSADLHNYISNYSRVAYYLELQQPGGPVNYVWASMDAFSPDAGKIGVPTAASGAAFQQPITNLSVVSSLAGVTPCTNASGGNLEFWPSNYDPTNAANVAGASSVTYDWGDRNAGGSGHGSMQVHNAGASQVVFAFNNWGGSGTTGNIDLGIGSNTGNTNADWTFMRNGANYSVKRLQVFVLPNVNNPPVLISAVGQTGQTNVVLTFSEPLDEDASNIIHYALSGSVSVLRAVLDPVTKVTVTLTTSAEAPNTWYTVTVNGVQDRTASHTPIAANSTASFLTLGTPAATLYANVPEVTNYTLVYSLSIPNAATYSTTGVPYNTDNHFGVTNYTRIAYYLELATSGGPTNWLWVAMDPFTQDAGKIGVPTTGSGAIFQQNLTNLTIYSSVAGVSVGTNFSGNIEFWPRDYTTANALNVPNASGTTYDWGDTISASGNHGSMQIHNYASRQTLFAMNNWNVGTSAIALGIGNNPGAHPDWTLMANAGTYVHKRLQVFVLAAPDTNAFLLVRAVGAVDLEHVTVTFSQPVEDASAVNLANYSLSGGVTIISAVLSNNLREVILTTSPLLPTNYILTVNSVRDRTSNANSIPANSTAAITLPATTARIAANVAEAVSYRMVYSLAIPSPASFNAGVPYNADNHFGVTNYTRVAYFLELATSGGPTNWIWVSLDAFTSDSGKIGVPSTPSGAFFQQIVNNMNVYSSVAGIVTGAGITTGNMEFWPGNYTEANAIGIPNASGTVFDWGDGGASAITGYGSMQLHNHGARQVLFALNNWNNGSTPCIGISNQPTGNPDWTFNQNAGSYVVKNLQVFVLPAAPFALQLSSATATQDVEHVTVTFNQPVADSAANAGNYSLNGGVVVLSAVLSNNLRQVILTTTPLKLAHTLTVSGVRDRSTAANLITPGSSIAVTMPVQFARLATYAPEAQNYELVYQLAVPANSPGWNALGATYDIDNRGTVGSFSRIAYCWELASGGVTNWVYVSMDPFTSDVNKIGIPERVSGAVFQQKLTNMNVYSSVASIVQTNNCSSGNIEFWPWNYAGATTALIPNGTSAFDWNDTMSTDTSGGDGGHGSMQIHNWGASQTLFGYSAWGGARVSEMGLGNQVGGNGNPDWTSTANAASYTVRNLYVLVLPATDTNGPVLVSAVAQGNLNNVIVSFNEPLADSAANPWNYSLSGGATVTAGQLQPNRRQVLLTVSTLAGGTTYTLTVNNVRDRSTNANFIAANSTTTFAVAPVFGRVPEATSYTLVEYLALPGAVPNYNVNGITYGVDQRALLLRQPFDRIAYYLELATTVGGTTNWIYVSSEAFAPNINRVGVPVYGSGAFYQQKLTNMNVSSSVAGIVNTNGCASGIIEFWPSNYGNGTNTLGICTNGSNTAFDWNDSGGAGNSSGYGSMQIHNWYAGSTGQVLFAFNKWGGGQTGNGCLGIGNRSGTVDVDWTFADNAATYAVRNLYVLVRPTNAPPSTPGVAVMPPVIVQQPASRAKFVGEATTLAAQASGTAPLSYQWRLNGTPLPGQTNAWLTFSNLQTTNSGSYDLIASNPAGSATSLAAVLTVGTDAAGPSIVSVGSLNGWDIGVVFDRPVDPASAGSTRFIVTSAAGDSYISSVTPRPDGRSFLIMLDYSPVPGAFTVEADWIRNLSGAETEQSFGSGTVLNAAAASQNLGVGVGTIDPLYIGTSFVGSSDNFIEVLAGGSGVSGTSDGLHLVSQSMTGDFVARVQVTGVLPTDPNALAGLMVRPTFATNDQYFGVFATPAAIDGGAGVLQTMGRAVSNAPAAVLGTVPQVAYPNNWLRLKRAGNTFIASSSANGLDWVPFMTNTPSPAYPGTVVLGMATTARNNAAGVYTKAGFANFGVLAPIVITSQPQPASATVDVLTSITFSNLTLTSPLPVTYQWRKNGVAIPGATGTNLTLANLYVTNSGNYSVALTSGHDLAISADCVLTVTNALPLVQPELLLATQNVARVITTAELLGNDSDPEGSALSIVGAYGQAVTFATDFNSGTPANTALYNNGVAGCGTIVTNGTNVYLQLNPSAGTAAGAFVISNLSPTKAISAFTASFRARVGDTGVTEGADGFSFNFASDLPDAVSGTAEDGVGSGLSVCFDNYPAAGPGAPSVKIRWNNALVATNLIQKMNSANWFTVQVSLTWDGKLDVVVDGTNVFSRFQTSYQPLVGRFGLYGRTGGAYETHWIDDLSITAYTLHTAQGNTNIGGTVTVTNGLVYYTPPANVCANDSFYYVVSDGQVGGTSVGLATVTFQQVTGLVALEAFAGPTGNGTGSRAVTFTFTDGVSYTNSSVQTLSFVGGVAPYSVCLPAGAVRVSAKTAWNLRKRLPVALVLGQPVANFTGDKMLPAGDLDGSNLVDLADYYLLAAVWYQSNAAADLDGNGFINLDDYFLMSGHWNEQGEAP